MENQYGILVDLERCVGCYACEVACRQEHSAALTTPWIKLHTIGPRDTGARLSMEYVPLLTDNCILCRDRLKAKREPACVAVCPTQALRLCTARDMLADLRNYRRYQICGIKELR